ncbi:Trp biosynthesis-associated membrane protein [Cellulomonas oligotrophica]|uniref:Tryptophan-associated transmembrane protein n=1 Tax=Cellulomonas oligotrophica TaxID=931536 RepID=A0A7Y9FCN0_9CELL|nr:Trp biosynthesis-associated membrane protein [Cellulomonas oligotrophica]NYD84881.1 hypothetical protein [Cellulomonas oligotrophica]
MTTAPAPRRPGRGRWVVAVLAAAGVVGALALPTWVLATAGTPVDGDVALAVPGAVAAPGTVAGALVLLACAGALALVGRVGRWVVVGVVVLAGVLVAASAGAVLADPSGPAAAAVAEATGVVPAAPQARVTAWPVVAAAVGAGLVLLAGGLARASAAWLPASTRHEAPAAGTPRPVGQAPDERDDWDALSRGDDPSRGDGAA